MYISLVSFNVLPLIRLQFFIIYINFSYFRWFKHISEAAEAYKARTKGSHDITEDAATAANVSASGTAASHTSHHNTSNSKDQRESFDESIATADIGLTKNLQPNRDSKDNLINNNNECVDRNQMRDDGSVGGAGVAKTDRAPQDIGQVHNDEDDDEEDEEEDDDEDDDDDNDNYQNRESNSNNTRTITQQCSLIAPTEIQISVNATLTAEPVLTTNG